MKKIQLLVAGLATISLLSCDKKALDIKFDAPKQTVKLIIEPNAASGEYTIKQSIKIDNLELKAKENGVNDISFIKSVTIKKITATLDTVANNYTNFDLLESGSLSVRADKNPKIDTLKVGSFTVPKGVNTFQITPTSENYLVFSKESSIEYSAKIKTNAPITKKVYLTLLVESQAVANPTK